MEMRIHRRCEKCNCRLMPVREDEKAITVICPRCHELTFFSKRSLKCTSKNAQDVENSTVVSA